MSFFPLGRIIIGGFASGQHAHRVGQIAPDQLGIIGGGDAHVEVEGQLKNAPH